MSLEKEDKYLVARYSDTANGGLGGYESYTITSQRLEDEFFTPDFPVYTPDVTSPVNVPGILDDDNYLEDKDGYDPENLLFQSTDFAPDSLNYTLRRWIIEESIQPYTTKPDFDPFKPRAGSPYLDVSNPDGNNPWPNAPELDRGKFYKVSVQYVADEGNSAVSAPVYFKTESLVEDIDITDLNGLRFDGNRATTLGRAQTAGNSKLWTLSTWIKPTNLNGVFGWIQAEVSPGFSWSGLQFHGTDAPGKIRFIPEAGKDGNGVQSNAPLTINKWVHVVVAFDSAQANQVDRCKMYIDGVLQTENAGGGVEQNTESGFTSGKFLSIGEDAQGRYGDGYLSDVYFVDGIATDCNIFGEIVDGGKWAPRKPSDIKADIAAFAPSPDAVPNYDQKWSDGATGSPQSGGTAIENLFDGDLSTYTNSKWGDPSSAITYTFNPISFKKIRFYASAAQGVSSSYIKFNGVSQVASDGNNKWYDVTGVSGQLSTIEVYTQSSSDYLNPTAIEVDGRILIDGPADNSQIWSDRITTAGNAKFPFSNMFDGEPLTYAEGNENNVTCTFDPPITATSTIEVRAGGGAVRVNGSFFDPSGSGIADAVFEDVTSTAGSLTLTSIGLAVGNASVINGIRIDGKELVDGGAQWNTSQVWSDAATGDWNPSYGKENVFDGSLATEGGAILGTGNTPDAITTVVMPFTGFSSISSLRLHASLSGQNSHGVQDGRIIINGVDITAGGLSSIWAQNGGHNDHRWVTIPVADIGNKLENITLTSTDVVAPYFKAIEVDGQILVDGVDGFGANGFYLPFDPEAVGGDSYANRTVATNTRVGRGPDNIYNAQKYGDGKEDDTCNIVSGGGYIKLSNVNFENVSKFEFTENHSGTVTVTFNDDGSTTQTVTSPSGQTNIDTEVSAPATITSIEFNTDDSFWLSWIKINGEMLIDYNNIGVDDSGKENHFHDKNFAVGNASQVWSSSTTSDTGTFAIGTPANSFDGDHSTGCFAGNTDTATSQYKVTFNPALTGSLKTVTYSGNAVTVNGVLLGENTVTAEDIGVGTYDVVNMSELIISYGSAPSRPGIRWLELNGSELVDANIQDTVLDNPVTDYAVLNEGKNGNLVGKGADGNSINGDSSKEYYWEETDTNGVITGMTAYGPVNVSGTYSGLYPINFGQQPFADPNVTRNDDNTVTIPNPNNLGNWSSRATASSPDGGTGLPNMAIIGDLFDGDINKNFAINSDNGKLARLTFDPPFTGTTVEVYVDQSGTATEKTANGTTDLLADGWNTVSGGSLTYLEAKSGSGSGSFYVSAIRVDGLILVDGSSNQNTSRKWSDYMHIVNPASPAEKGFDGDDNTSCGDGSNPMHFDISANPLPINSSLVIYASRNYNATTIRLNSNPDTDYTFDISNSTRVEIDLKGETELKRIDFLSPANLYSVYVDGVCLVDPSGFQGGTFNLLTEKLVDWSTYGDLYYHPVEDKVRALSEIREGHGKNANPYHLGYSLIEKGNDGEVFMKKGDQYTPVRRADQLLSSIKDKLASLQSELAN